MYLTADVDNTAFLILHYLKSQQIGYLQKAFQYCCVFMNGCSDEEEFKFCCLCNNKKKRYEVMHKGKL
jgi:hypothetical protein